MAKAEIQIFLRERKARLILLGGGPEAYQDLPIAPELISGNDEEDCKYAAAHVIEAMTENGLISDTDEIAIVNMPETQPEQAS